jgi:hypothetical protein
MRKLLPSYGVELWIVLHETQKLHYLLKQKEMEEPVTNYSMSYSRSMSMHWLSQENLRRERTQETLATF